jgi:hypothetical protein
LLEEGVPVVDLRGRFLAVCVFTTEEVELEEEEDEEEDDDDEVSLNLSRLIVAGIRDGFKLSAIPPLQSFFSCKKLSYLRTLSWRQRREICPFEADAKLSLFASVHGYLLSFAGTNAKITPNIEMYKNKASLNLMQCKRGFKIIEYLPFLSTRLTVDEKSVVTA